MVPLLLFDFAILKDDDSLNSESAPFFKSVGFKFNSSTASVNSLNE